jgi:hypothetical protein
LIVFVTYLLIFLFLIAYNGFFGIFNDPVISRRKFAFLFLLKALAVPTFYFIHQKLYGGIDQLDAGKFYADSKVISDYALEDPIAYLRFLFGFQDDSHGSYDYVHYIVRTNNWDTGETKSFIYKDNRIVIRLHSLLHFIAFGSYFAHALFSCLFSFIGITFFYKSVRAFFDRREIYVLLVLCFFPALWFYTGGLLKEGIAVLVMGSQALALQKIFSEKYTRKTIAVSVILLLISCLLKPYLLLFFTVCFGLFLYLNKKNLKHSIVLFVTGIALAAALANLTVLVFKGSSLMNAIERHRRDFTDVAQGGIFLDDSLKFVRLPYNLSLVKKIPGRDSLYTVKQNVPYTYRYHKLPYDTLYCKANTDTTTQYKLRYLIVEGNSNLAGGQGERGIANSMLRSLYYSLLYPFFNSPLKPLSLLASLENLFLLISFLVVLTGFLLQRKPALLPFVFVSIALGICLLAGEATPNSGAIFRYRSPVAPFILLAALYYLPFIGPIRAKPSDKN